jgi:hypothetical protein
VLQDGLHERPRAKDTRIANPLLSFIAPATFGDRLPSEMYQTFHALKCLGWNAVFVRPLPNLSRKREQLTNLLTITSRQNDNFRPTSNQLTTHILADQSGCTRQ